MAIASTVRGVGLHPGIMETPSDRPRRSAASVEARSHRDFAAATKSRNETAAAAETRHLLTDRTRCEALLERGREAAEQQDPDSVERHARAALTLLGEVGGDEELRVDAWLLLAWAALARDELDEALAWARRAQEIEPDEPEALLMEGSALLRGWDLVAADDRLARSRPAEDEIAAAVLYQRAVVADLRERFDLADDLYRQAARLDPQGCPLPFRMDGEKARRLLAELVESFPDDVRRALTNVRIDLVPVPRHEIEGRFGHDPFLLGIYDGVPVPDVHEVPVVMPGRVRIFQRNIERVVRDRDDLVEQLRITLLHEVGHHLGWDEDDLAERGLA